MIKHYFNENIYASKKIETIILNDEQTKIINMHIDGVDVETIVKSVYPNVNNENMSKAITIVKMAITQYENLLELSDINFTGEYRKAYPLVLNVELTNKCNFYCKFCYKNACLDNNKFVDDETIDLIIKNAGKFGVIHLTGGEPMLHPRFKELIHECSKSTRVNVTTNLSLHSLMDDETLSKVCNFQVSLYGYNDTSYYEITGTSNFQELTLGLKRLHELNISHYLMLVATDFVKDHVIEYKNFIEKIGSPLKIGSLCTMGRAKDMRINDDLTNFVRNLLSEFEIKNKTNEFSILNKTTNEKIKPVCGAGRTNITINENNMVVPCIEMSNINFEIKTFKNFLSDIENNVDFDSLKFIKERILCDGICELIKEDI